MRLQRVVFLGILLFLAGNHTNLSAQKNVPLISSLDQLKRGIELSDSGFYSKACTLFEQISRSDSNYLSALFEDAVSRESNGEDSMAIAICNKGLETSSEYIPDFYKLKAGALIDLKKYDEAINLMHKAIREYPNIYLLHFTLGLAHYEAKNYDSAVASFERSINLNAFHSSSHYYLGRCCVEQGRIVPAMLSLQFCLLLEPLTTRSFGVVQLMEKVAENKYDFNKATKVGPTKYGDEPFSDIELLVTSQIALNPEYKLQSKINYSIVKQCQLIYDKVNYDPKSNNFWMKTYVPFFNDMKKKEYFDSYSCYIMQSVNDDALQEIIKKEKKKIDEFVGWADNEITSMHHTRQITVDGKTKDVACYYYANHMIQAIGPENEKGKQVGEWIIYHENNGTIAAKGSFDDNDNRIGNWQWFYTNGALKERTAYIGGKKEGISETWYENGAPKSKYNYKNDLMEGESWEYNSSGMPATYGSYKQNKPIGKFTLYFADGRQHYVVNYGEQGLDGEQKEYYVTGQLKLSTLYKNGKKNGIMTDYWSNGKIKDQGNYQDDKAIGHFKFYFEDGPLQKEADYLNGNLSGTMITYFRNGKKADETHFGDGGRMDGADIIYDEDGIKYGELDYQKDELQHYQYLDKNGKVITEAKLTDKKLHHENYYPNGIKHSEGESVNGLRQGVWKFYSITGALITSENYDEGRVDGMLINYYSNGQVKDKVEYKGDLSDGYYKEYYQNGTIKAEGWYVAGAEQGDWYYYNVRGGTESHYYYVDGVPRGYIDYYNPAGSLCEEDYYTLGYLDKIWVYDSTGKNAVYTYNSDKGNGHYASKYPGGQSKTERTYVAGYQDGHEKRYYYNGKLLAEGDYLLDKHEGAYKTYYDNGSLQSIYTYINGELNGPALTYFKSGKMKIADNYFEDEENGAYKEYYETGNVCRDGQDSEGALEGKCVCYSQDSLIYCVSWHHNGIITGYSYPDKNGNLVPTKPLINGTGSIKAYYANGNKSLENSYNAGSLDGKRTEYFSNGNIFEDENYVMGNFDGTQKYFYPNGKPQSQESYYMGERDGKSTYFYENGKVEHEESWVLGNKQGSFNYYDNSGKLIRTAVYYNNDEIYETSQ
jgi:antitoxin component YwqK of YwqJK toxin-antitoxin module